MPIITLRRDLLASRAEVLVNTVNTVGVMGAGIAKQFRDRYPAMFEEYRKRCASGQVQVGRMDTHIVRDHAGIRLVMNFPTKQHWKNPSELEWVEMGLRDLTSMVRLMHIKSVAIPPLGCGLGGLHWEDVRPLIEHAFATLPDVQVELYEPA